jgi:IclR family acetate operon transcriptional repressor
MSDGPTLIQSVQRALRLLEVVAEHDGRAHAKQLSRAAGLSLPTTYHLLRTLAHEGYLRRLDEGTYVLGDRLDVVLRDGRGARTAARARRALESLRDELGSAVYLASYDQGEIVIVEIVDSPKAPRIDLWVGIHDAAHATALGKCILGQLDDETREAYLAGHPLHELTPHTVVDRRRLQAQLAESATVAVDDQEYALGVGCLAVPVRTLEMVGALAVADSPRRLGDRAAVHESLVAGAARVSRALTLA